MGDPRRHALTLSSRSLTSRSFSIQESAHPPRIGHCALEARIGRTEVGERSSRAGSRRRVPAAFHHWGRLRRIRKIPRAISGKLAERTSKTLNTSPTIRTARIAVIISSVNSEWFSEVTGSRKTGGQSNALTRAHETSSTCHLRVTGSRLLDGAIWRLLDATLNPDSFTEPAGANDEDIGTAPPGGRGSGRDQGIDRQVR